MDWLIDLLINFVLIKLIDKLIKQDIAYSST
mgnify:FL=1